MSEKINFLDQYTQYLSPFSAHQIEIWGEQFATVEHAYHAARYVNSPERDAIKSTRSPLDAWRECQKHKKTTELLNKDFNKNRVMEELFRAKLAQHTDVKKMLQETEGKELVKVIDTDYYWGTGADGSGENQMGKLWMSLREELKNQ